MNDLSKKKLRSHFFENFHKPFSRCLAPEMSCNEAAIRAHSVQNSLVLDLLVRNGHVKAPRIKIDSVRGPIISIEDIGRNQATTFTGFCSPHDSTIFRPLDSRAFDHRDPNHRFLAAYRAVSRKLHAQMEGAVRIQGNYQKRVELGLDSGNGPTVAGMVAVEHMMKAYQTYEHKFSSTKH
jgi:hypothetical protein